MRATSPGHSLGPWLTSNTVPSADPASSFPPSASAATTSGGPARPARRKRAPTQSSTPPSTPASPSSTVLTSTAKSGDSAKRSWATRSRVAATRSSWRPSSAWTWMARTDRTGGPGHPAGTSAARWRLRSPGCRPTGSTSTSCTSPTGSRRSRRPSPPWTNSSREGKVRYIGHSNLAGWQIAEAEFTAAANGHPRFISAQNEYNLLTRAPEQEILPAVNAYGLGIPAMVPALQRPVHRQVQSATAGRPRAGIMRHPLAPAGKRAVGQARAVRALLCRARRHDARSDVRLAVVQAGVDQRHRGRNHTGTDRAERRRRRPAGSPRPPTSPKSPSSSPPLKALMATSSSAWLRLPEHLPHSLTSAGAEGCTGDPRRTMAATGPVRLESAPESG